MCSIVIEVRAVSNEVFIVAVVEDHAKILVVALVEDL